MKWAKHVATGGIAGAVGGTLLLAAQLIKPYEGYAPTAYLDPVEIPTICYGHTQGVEMGTTLSEEQCEGLLAQDLQKALDTLERYVTVPLPDTRRAALASFVYNVGAGKFSHSTLLQKLNAGDIRGACNELSRWVYAGGRKLTGLVKRRAAERDMCLQGLGTELASREAPP